MNTKKIISIILIIGIISLIIFILYRAVFSVSQWPEKINDNSTFAYTINETSDSIVYTRYTNNQNFLANMATMYIPKIVTTYTLKDDIVIDTVVQYYYFRESDAKKAYNKDTSNSNEFFKFSKSIDKNIITENMSEVYKGKPKDEVIANIKNSYK